MALSIGEMQMKNIMPENWTFEQEEETKEKPLVIVGTGLTMLQDLNTVAYIHADYMAINAGALLVKSEIKYLASQHYENMPCWVNGRTSLGFNKNFTSISIEPYKCVDKVMELEVHNGSSGLYGTLCGLKLGYKKIILCGIGLDTDFHKRFSKTWERICPNIKNYVKSLSGLTKDILGQPTKEWLETQS